MPHGPMPSAARQASCGHQASTSSVAGQDSRLQRRLPRPARRRRPRVLPRAAPRRHLRSPRRLRDRQAFTGRTLERIAGDCLRVILGPTSHSFVDGRHFAPAPLEGQPVAAAADRLAALRRACGDEEWAEAGFTFDRGLVYLFVSGAVEPIRLGPPGFVSQARGDKSTMLTILLIVLILLLLFGGGGSYYRGRRRRL